MTTISDRIKEVRKEENISQEEFARRVGIKQTTISQIETGIIPVSERVKKIISQEFGVTEEWLDTGTGKKECGKRLPSAVEILNMIMDLEEKDRLELKSLINKII